MEAEFPEAAKILFDSKPRYICLWGGRGSGKSWSIARALLIRAAATPLRILCARELQNSIAESVHKLLSVQIDNLGLGDFYTVQQQSIVGANGSEFIFTGLKNNSARIKSYEGVDICFVEEAQAITQSSWEILTPTIRKVGSQIILSFNPILEADFVYQRFIVSPPENSIVVKMNFDQNPWFGEPLATEMRQMEREDPDGYAHIWGGNPRHALQGAVFAKELREAELGDRITSVPWVQSKPVSVFFDLGKRDMTSLWFAQVIGFEFRVIDFYENCGETLAHYIKFLKEKPYVYGEHWLPHDADHDLLASERTIAQQMRAAFSGSVRVQPITAKVTQIEAGRSIFGQCWFDREKTADGVQHLRHYQYEVDPQTGQRGKLPLHDEHSHAADAFMGMALSLRQPKSVKPKVAKPRTYAPAGAWMG